MTTTEKQKVPGKALLLVLGLVLIQQVASSHQLRNIYSHDETTTSTRKPTTIRLNLLKREVSKLIAQMPLN